MTYYFKIYVNGNWVYDVVHLIFLKHFYKYVYCDSKACMYEYILRKLNFTTVYVLFTIKTILCIHGKHKQIHVQYIDV